MKWQGRWKDRKKDKGFPRRWSLKKSKCIIEVKWFISKFAGQIHNKRLPRAREERQLAPQASAGYPLSLNSLLAIRKAQRGPDKKASEKWPNPPAAVRGRYVPYDCKQADFSSGTLRSRDNLDKPFVWPSTNLEMISK